MARSSARPELQPSALAFTKYGRDTDSRHCSFDHHRERGPYRISRLLGHESLEARGENLFCVLCYFTQYEHST